MKKGRRQAGFTLIELMFTIAVAAVLLAIGVPNFRDFIRNSRMSAEANDLLTGVSLARSEAVKRRAPVTLCAGATACGATESFADGWIVFVDTDADGTTDAGEEILRSHAAMNDDVTVALYETTDDEEEDAPEFDDSDTNYVSFGQNGFRRMNDGSLPVALAIVLCDARGNSSSNAGADVSAARALELTTSGRAGITRSKERIDTIGGCAT